MARTSFSSPDATIVVSGDGYFDVYPPTGRSNGDKPSYRGVLAELGAGIRGGDDRLAVRPDSAALGAAVDGWLAVHGGAAVRGDLGRGRDGTKPEAWHAASGRGPAAPMPAQMDIAMAAAGGEALGPAASSRQRR